MSVKTFTRSFAGGEISPLLHGRLDLAKFQTGLAKALNFMVTPQGPIENRPGFEYVVRAKAIGDMPVLIPFVYNGEQSFALEFGPGYIRFHTQGAALLEAAKSITAITQANPAVINIPAHGYLLGDWLFFSGVAGMPDMSGRWVLVGSVLDADHFTLTDLFGVIINTSAMAAYTGGGTASKLYEIQTPYTAADLASLHYVQSADVLTIVHPNYAPRELRRLGATNWTLTTIAWDSTLTWPLPPTVATAGPGGGTPTDYGYATTALVTGTLEETGPSIPNFVNIDLSVAGNHVDITPDGSLYTVGQVVRYNIYKGVGLAGMMGYIGQSDGGTFRDDNITPDMSRTPPLARNPFTTDWPRAVSYYEQRRVLAGTSNLPQTLWATRSGTERNMSYSIPTQDDDAINARIVAREAQTIRHLVPLGDLLALTSGGVWRISSSDGGPLTPATLTVKPQSYVGASNVQPVVTGSSVLYHEDRGAHLREVTYSWEAQGYKADDVSVLAPHLFDFRTVRQMAYARSPYQVLWEVRDDGTLLGLTYQPEHEVKAWHQHTTDGVFASACSVPEDAGDTLYAIVQRHVNGQTLNYIERLHRRQFNTLADAFFVDCGATYSGAPATLIRGLWHLEGKSVVVLADGGVQGPFTVADGKITLAAAASTVHVGLAYDCDAQTLPLSMEALAAFGQGVPKNINQAWLSVYQSSAIQAGPSFENLREYPQRTVLGNPYGSPPVPKTGIASIKLDAKWQDDAALCVRQSQPLPLTLRAFTVEVAVGG